FQNKLSPMQFMLQWQTQQPIILNMSQESRIGWGYTASCFRKAMYYNKWCADNLAKKATCLIFKIR
ncbi:MAG: hypothetical protein WC158_02685, partial [Candidatus Paceibacterota bacterium]